MSREPSRGILIACYSFSGSTQALAEEIALQAGGTVRVLVPEEPYAFDYNTAAKEARSQIARGFCPKLSSGNEPIDAYDMVFVGTPNWFKSMAPPLLSFLRSHDFTGKTVIPFCTHGGGGAGQIEDEVRRACGGATLLPGMALAEGPAPEKVAAWLAQIGMKKGGHSNGKHDDPLAG